MPSFRALTKGSVPLLETLMGYCQVECVMAEIAFTERKKFWSKINPTTTSLSKLTRKIESLLSFEIRASREKARSSPENVNIMLNKAFLNFLIY